MNTYGLSNRGLAFLVVALLGVVSRVESFQPTAQRFQNLHATALAAESSTTSMATLTETTTWTMRMNLENLPTEKGKKTGGIYVVQAKFIEEEGYEPPQGLLQQSFPEDSASDEDDADNEQEKTSSISQMTVSSGRWTLSEDPEDRKDGLWYVGRCKRCIVFISLWFFKLPIVILTGSYLCSSNRIFHFPHSCKGSGAFSKSLCIHFCCYNLMSKKCLFQERKMMRLSRLDCMLKSITSERIMVRLFCLR